MDFSAQASSTPRRSWRWLPALCGFVIFGSLAVLGARPSGDGFEYLLQARALTVRASPEIRAEDARWLAERVPAYRRAAHRLLAGMRADAETPIAAVRRSASGGYYAIHFWLYALLCAPLLPLAELAHTGPERALALGNGLAASIAALSLWVQHGRRQLGVAAVMLFSLAGTTFYLGWTGPEVLTASAVVCACVASRQRELGLGWLAGAIAAAQNASALVLLPFVLWSCRTRRVTRRDGILCALALALVVWPYAFFYAKFRVASPLAHFATDVSFMSFARAWSVVFDLNQGLILGEPGVLFGVILAAAGLLGGVRAARAAVLGQLSSTIALCGAMLLPTLAVANWNSGCSVICRYAYWSCMPLVVLALELLERIESRFRWAALGGIAALQIAAIVPQGLWGQRYSYLRHSWLAQLALRHAPSIYNPVPEIFNERSLGREVELPVTRSVGWPARAPRKILAARGGAVKSAQVCAQGTVASHDVHVVGAWMYLDAPFECEP